MDNFLKTDNGFKTALKLIETINRSTDDYLFIWDIANDKRWFFGDIDKYYDIDKSESATITTNEFLKIIHSADADAVLKSLNDVKDGKQDFHDMDYRWINRNGQKVWVNCHGSVIRDDKNNPHLMIGRASEEKLRHLYNPLTSLWNHIRLMQDLTGLLDNSKGYLLLLDIDRLSSINLTHGSEYGDSLLKEIAEFIEKVDGVIGAYHIEHNNFVLMLDADSDAEVSAVYETVKRQMLDKCTFTASAAPVDKTIFFNETQLIEALNVTLKNTKMISKNRLEFFSQDDIFENISTLALLEELRQSVENDCDGFEVYYQPQVRSGSYEIYGVEALLRYNSKTIGMTFPSEFIPVLEQSRLIHKVGLWVLRQALSQCKKWRKFAPKLYVSVNLSPLQFEDPLLSSKIIDEIQKVGLSGDALTLEITESAGLVGNISVENTIKKLKSHGIFFSIDDFGTGYSNLVYLKQLFIDEIKIDRAFVSDIEKKTYNHKLIGNIIEFANANGIMVCCEGIENTRELGIIETLSPDILQGYLFDKPMSAASIEKRYFDNSSPEFKRRTEFVKRLYEYKEKMGVIHFDSKSILEQNELGLWIMRIDSDAGRYEMHTDATMEKSMAIDGALTPTECYKYLVSNIHPDYFDYVEESFEKMIAGDKAVQIEFPWLHKKLGDVMIRISGKRVDSNDNKTVLEGYCIIITDVTGA